MRLLHCLALFALFVVYSAAFFVGLVYSDFACHNYTYFWSRDTPTRELAEMTVASFSFGVVSVLVCLLVFNCSQDKPKDQEILLEWSVSTVEPFGRLHSSVNSRRFPWQSHGRRPSADLATILAAY